MKAGKLRTRATIQRPAAIVDPHGQDTEAVVNLGTFWCEDLSTAGIERLLGSQAIAEAVRAIQFRGRIDVRPSDCLLIGSKVVDLTQVINPDGRGIATVCVGKERLG